MNKTLLFLFLAIVSYSSYGKEQQSSSAFGDNNYFLQRSEEGYFWYKDPVEEEEPGQQQMTPQSQEPDPLEQLKAYQKDIERARAKAVMNPTEENVMNYMYVQKEVMDRATLFSDVWKRVVWKTPELDYTQTVPTNNLAKKQYVKLRKEKIKKSIEEASKEYGFFYFFRGTCDYCHVFSPVVRMFSEKYGIEVIPVSLDGGVMEDFPRPRADNGWGETLGVSTVPALFLVKPSTQEVIKVANGMTSMQDLEERVYQLTSVNPGEDI